MTVTFTPWPEGTAKDYREKGYWIDLPLTDILQRQVEQQPEATAIICGERCFSYADMGRLSDQLAAQLLKRGLQQGDTALVQLNNHAEFYLVFFALLKIGVVPVFALFNHNRNELNNYATFIRPKVLIADCRHPLFVQSDYLKSLQQRVPELEQVLMLGGCDYADSLEEALTTPITSHFVRQETAADQVAFFQLSGGSTGTPKLIPRTHNDYYYSIRRSAEITKLNKNSRYLCALPAAHNYPMSSPGALGIFYAGGCVVMASDPSASTCFPLIERHQVNIAALVPPAVMLWLQEAAQNRKLLSSLRLLQVGGAHFSEAVAKRVLTELGCQLQQVLGMAEGLVNYTRLDDDERLICTTQGYPMSPDDEIKIVDEQRQPVAPGEVGQLATRGPYTFRGYYQNPEQNAQAFDEQGFYYTGDLVQQTPEGYLRVVGRIKDQINRGGEKISAEEIESFLLHHPDVIHAALVSIPDATLGEKSCAFIVSRNAELNALNIRKYLRQFGIAEYKLPDRIELVEKLPVTAVGKIDKKSLRQTINEQ